MSIESNWCLNCLNCSEEIPEHLKKTFEELKEYKYKIYCKVYDCLVVANENMWIDKTETCSEFKRRS